MPHYAVYCKNYLKPCWDRFKKPVYTPSKWARFYKALGFPARYERQMEEIVRMGALDPAQDDINAWVERWNLDPQVFATRPRTVWLDSTEKRVSEIFDSRDLCALLLDTRFNSSESRGDSDFGSRHIWSVHDNGSTWALAVGYTFNDFYIKEVPEGEE